MDTEFILGLLLAVEQYAPIGFDKATMEFQGIKVQWTTIIVNDDQMIEVEIWDRDKNIVYWRATRLEVALEEFVLWKANY